MAHDLHSARHWLVAGFLILGGPRLDFGAPEFSPAVSPPAKANRESRESLFKDWLREYSAATRPEPEMEVQGLELARERRKAMRRLIETDPQRAWENRISWEQRRGLPPAIQREFEELVSGAGELAVFGATPLPGQTNGFRPIIREATIDGWKYEAFVYGRRVNQPTRENISLHGIALDGVMAVSDSPVRVLEKGEPPSAGKVFAPAECPISGKSTAAVWAESGNTVYQFCTAEHASDLAERLWEAEQSTTAVTIGAFSALILVVDFPDVPGGNTTVSNALDVMRQVDAFYRSNSFQKFSIDHADATPVMRMTQPGSYYSPSGHGLLMAEALSAARGLGYSPANYRFLIVSLPNIGFPWGGLGYIGASGAFVQGPSFRLSTTQHELGHNLGLWHAGGWLASDESVIGPGGRVEYGNEFDIMGSGPSHFNAVFKRIVGWLEDGNVTTAWSDGIHRIHAIDSGGEVIPGAAYALRIPAGPPLQGLPSDYWIDFRREFSMHGVSSGALVHWATNSSGVENNHLLDMNPAGVNGFRDAALVVGRTFVDGFREICITPIAKGDTWLEIAVKFRPSNTSVPSVTLVASANAVIPGEVVQFTATATDADGDSLTYYWDFDDGTVADASLNQPSATKSWATAREYLVRCVVSDMKGGEASASALVRVGSPNTYHVGGRVSSLNDVRVHNGLSGPDYRGTFTDSEGRFVLTGLPAGNYAIGASKPGQTFKPLFVNPVSVGPSNVESLEFEPRAAGVPIVMSFAPSNGTVGTPVIIHGMNFQYSTAVKFGNVSAIFTNESPERIRARVPSGAIDGPITVTGSVGTDISTAIFTIIQTAPTIARHPASQTNGYTLSTYFVAEVYGSGPLTYQWRKEGLGIPGATNNNLELVNLKSEDGGWYDLVARNPMGSVTSAPALLTLETRPTFAEMLETPGIVWLSSVSKPWITQSNITHDGVDAAASALVEPFSEESWLETTVSFTEPQLMRFWRQASGPGIFRLFRGSATTLTEVLRYLGSANWIESSVILPPGEHRLRFSASRTSLLPGLAAPYRVWVDQVSLVPGIAPLITREPEDMMVAEGESATLYVEATGSPPPTYQWYRVFGPLNIQPVGTGPTVTDWDVETLDGYYPYYVVVQNEFGSVTSRQARISAAPPPVINILSHDSGDEVGPIFQVRLSVTGQLPITNVALFNGPSVGSGVKMDETSVPEADGTFVLSATNQPGREFHIYAFVQDNGGGRAYSSPMRLVCVTPLITNAVWKYLDNGANLGGSWSMPGYNDSAWASGRGPFGFGEYASPPENGTTIRSGGGQGSNYITTFFRAQFEVAEPARMSNLVMRLQCLGGAAVYFNGFEIWRRNLPPGPIDFRTRASEPTEYPELSRLRVESSRLQPGRNHVAVELHLADPWVTSMFFDLTLVGDYPPGPPSITLSMPREGEPTAEPNQEVLADVFDPDGDITRVVFFVNGLPFAERSAPPWSAIVSNLPPRGHLSRLRAAPRFHATVVDSRGSQASSAAVELNYLGNPGALDFIQLGGGWYYQNDTVEIGTVWREDPVSPGWHFGYLEMPQTELVIGTQRVTRFRRVFDLPTPAAYTNLLLHMLCEVSEGAIIYFNGVEVFRHNLPAGPLPNGTYTGLPPGPFSYVRANITPALLRSIDNLVAVEMYQNGSGSARSGFDFALMGQVALTDPRLKIQRGSDGYVYLSWDWNYWYSGLIEYADHSPDGPWLPSHFTGQGGSVFGVAPGTARFFRFRWYFTNYND